MARCAERGRQEEEQLAEAARRKQRRSLEALVLSHRHRLSASFAAEAPGGRIGVGGWCGVMQRTLGLQLDWRAVQPDLAVTVPACRRRRRWQQAQTSDSGLIDYERFLEAARNNAVADGGGGVGVGGGGHDAAALPGGAAFEVLYDNVSQLALVFRFLDTDDSGVLDKAEFRAGIELLNRRLPPEQALGDIDVLFQTIDLDGNGQIEFDEFCEVFKL